MGLTASAPHERWKAFICQQPIWELHLVHTTWRPDPADLVYCSSPPLQRPSYGSRRAASDSGARGRGRRAAAFASASLRNVPTWVRRSPISVKPLQRAVLTIVRPKSWSLASGSATASSSHVRKHRTSKLETPAHDDAERNRAICGIPESSISNSAEDGLFGIEP